MTISVVWINEEYEVRKFTLERSIQGDYWVQEYCAKECTYSLESMMKKVLSELPPGKSPLSISVSKTNSVGDITNFQHSLDVRKGSADNLNLLTEILSDMLYDMGYIP